MNKDIILHSNLLDIIFDGRNKEYGAYNLRKNYASRMQMALSGMIGISIVFCVVALSENSNKNAVINVPQIISQGNKLLPYKGISNAAKQLKITTKHVNNSSACPVIVHSVDINKMPATPESTEQSISATTTTETIEAPTGTANEVTFGKEIQEASTAPIKKNERPIVLEHPDVMPEYPGGVKALLDFLKRNLREPDGADADEVAVKVKFVVNYNGNLESFDVIESGGSSYDSEVLRVLKKMPQWIPGKSNGQNVSVYYVVPGRFTKED